VFETGSGEVYSMQHYVITSEQYFRNTNVFESRAVEVYSIQHYVITSEQYNAVAESENNIVICVQ
jgi:hypothetical protein